MSQPFVAGSFTSEPHRVHAYSSGVFMIVNDGNQGCWTDPDGRVLLPSLDIVDRILRAHGYERDEMLVRKMEKREEKREEKPEPPTPEPAPQAPAKRAPRAPAASTKGKGKK